MHRRFKIFFITFFLLAVTGKFLCAQNYEVSLPEKLNYGTNRNDVLGTSTFGIVVLDAGKTTHTISVYSSDMKLKWKKPIALKEFGFVNVNKVYLLEDSLLVFYTIQVRGMTILKAAKVNSQLNLIRPATVVDTLATSTLLAVPSMNYCSSFGKKRFLIYYDDFNNSDKRKLHAYCVDDLSNVKWKNEFRSADFMEPETVTAVIDDSFRCWFLMGENQVKNFHNDFPYNKFMLVSYNDSIKKFSQTISEESGMIFTNALLKLDMKNKQIIAAGLYALSPGAESNGIIFLRFNLNGELKNKKLIPYSTDLLSQLTGNNPPKRNDGFFSFQPSDFVVKNDGGIIFLAESYSISTEAFNSPGYGNFGGTTSLTVNYYHFDEVLAFSISDTGGVEWNQVIHKKQQTESDGGIFSSFALVIAPAQLILVFNDFSGGMDVLSTFTLQPDGKVERTEIFNADKKGLLPVVKTGKQISSNEFVMPSLKKGYLQYLKIIF